MPIMLSLRFEGTLLCKCSKLIELDPIKEAFEIPAFPISGRGAKCAPNLFQMHHHKVRDAQRSATKGDHRK